MINVSFIEQNSLFFYFRHPQYQSRPLFINLVELLSRPEIDLLIWSEEDRSVHQQAAVLGAPLEAGKELYPELQNSYKKP